MELVHQPRDLLTPQTRASRNLRLLKDRKEEEHCPHHSDDSRYAGQECPHMLPLRHPPRCDRERQREQTVERRCQPKEGAWMPPCVHCVTDSGGEAAQSGVTTSLSKTLPPETRPAEMTKSQRRSCGIAERFIVYPCFILSPVAERFAAQLPEAKLSGPLE